MNLHEYQAKTLFRQYDINIPRCILAQSADEAVQAAQELGGNRWVIKAQIHAGGRGKAGGIKIAENIEQVHEHASMLINHRLVTAQTDVSGLPVNSVLVEEALDIKKEIYIGILIDRTVGRITLIASDEGGVNIEETAALTPDKIIRVSADPAAGYFPYIARRIAYSLNLDKKQTDRLTLLLKELYRLFKDKDLTLVEINPLVITSDDRVLALDAKITVDDNALYRHKTIARMYDPTQEDERENKALKLGLSYVAMHGNIGCMVNGAGLAMATMDLIKLHGGEPANFLDVGGGATSERVKEAFKLILSDPDVKSILVNIFGGIVRCDLIAEGIINAAKEIDLEIPLIVRLQGTNVELGQKMLDESNLNIVSVTDLTTAAQQAVAAAENQQRKIL